MLKFIHLTDLHLPHPGELLWGLDPHANLDAALTDIAKWHGDAEFCIISGDLTDSGAPAAYTALRQRLQAFPMPTHLMLGNHDMRETFVAQFPEVPTDPAGFVQTAFSTSEGRFLLLDTFKGGTSAGQYCDRRQDWLRNELETAGEQPVWLFMHHPPFDIGIDYMDRIKLEDHQAFADIVLTAGNVNHIFFGHVHRPIYVNWRGIPATALPALCHQVPMVRESLGGPPYSLEAPMYAVVTLSDDQVIVHGDAFLHRRPAEM